MKEKGPILEVHPVGAFRCNAYLLGCPRTGRGIIIDPGDDPELLLERVKALGLKVEALVHTHTHLDHVGASRRLSEALGAPIVIHPRDLPLYRMLQEQRRVVGFAPGEAPAEVGRFIEDADEIRAGDLSLEVLHTPGHTPGSLCLRTGQRLFSGDTLFRGSVGRTDLWGTSHGELIRSIEERLLPLGGDTEVLPGHGEATTIEEEKRSNPFLGGRS